MQPRMPANSSPYARLCLEAIAAAGLGSSISIGGAFGLSHYLEYRTTHDVGAWWTDAATPDIRGRLVGVVEEALRTEGSVRTRSWGEVTSIDLAREGRTVFSFQVAARSGLLNAPQAGPWSGGVLLDSLEDLVASKMVALVERESKRPGPSRASPMPVSETRPGGFARGSSGSSSVEIDGSLYPDQDPPTELRTLGDRIDYLHRMCAAWDFGILPDAATIGDVRGPGWRDAVDRCRFLTSPSYHLLREWHGLERLAFLGSVPSRISSDPSLEHV